MTASAPWGAESWAVVSEHMEGRAALVLVRLRLEGADHDLYALCEPGDPPRPLCRHEHPAPGAVRCHEATIAARALHSRETARRIALRPAPEGARYVEHCGAYWPAAAGGACPTCGELGNRLTPRALVTRARFDRALWWVDCGNINPVSAAADLGVEAHPSVRVMGAALLVAVEAAPDPVATLTAAGWAVTKGRAKKSTR